MVDPKSLYSRVMFQDFDEFEDNTAELAQLQVLLPTGDR